MSWCCPHNELERLSPFPSFWRLSLRCIDFSLPFGRIHIWAWWLLGAKTLNQRSSFFNTCWTFKFSSSPKFFNSCSSSLQCLTPGSPWKVRPHIPLAKLHPRLSFHSPDLLVRSPLTLFRSLHLPLQRIQVFSSLEKKRIPVLVAGWFIENLTQQDNLLRHKIVSSFSMLQTHQPETKAKSQFPV